MAFHAGYFDWPRSSTGEAVAESMGITAPTFQEHLRTAQQKILNQVLDASAEE
jgi:predicted DNA binding protein